MAHGLLTFYLIALYTISFGSACTWTQTSDLSSLSSNPNRTFPLDNCSTSQRTPEATVSDIDMIYSLWLIPSKNEFEKIEALKKIRPPHTTLRDPSRSKSYPYFAPHITLAAFHELPDGFHVNNLPLGSPPPPLRFLSWASGERYLSAFKINLEKTKAIAFRDQITTYLAGFGVESFGGNFPHMSLFYVDEAEERKVLREHILNNGYISKSEGSGDLILNSNPGTESTSVSQFTGVEVWLVDCSDAVNDWKVMQKRKL